MDSTITEAISSFPKPANRSDLRAFFGLVNQLSSSTDTITELLLPLRPLLSTKNEFLWSDQALANAKKHLVSVPTLAFFDVQKPTRLCTDASRHGLGLFCSNCQPRGSGSSYKLVPVFSPPQKRDMLLSSWNFWLLHGQL